LTSLLGSQSRILAGVKLEGVVCAVSRGAAGVLVLRDDTGVELLEVGAGKDMPAPGDRVRLEGAACLLRRRDTGVEIRMAPVVDYDGIHRMDETNGQIHLEAGYHPVRVDWFNQLKDSGLRVGCQWPGGVATNIVPEMLWHQDSAVDGAQLAPGLVFEAYEGKWDFVPDFDLLVPSQKGVAAGFDTRFRTRDELVGLRFAGLFHAPMAGVYSFTVSSDDGALLYVGESRVSVVKSGSGGVPPALKRQIDEPMANVNERVWAVVEGRVGFVTRVGKGLRFELVSDPGSTWVTVLDAEGLDSGVLLNAYVRVEGVARSVLTADRRLVLGQMSVAHAGGVRVVEGAPGTSPLALPLLGVGQVQGLRTEQAATGLPVRIHGVITSTSVLYDHWISVQDATRGIFIKLDAVSNFIPVAGQCCEVRGRTEAGNFAPIIVAEQVAPLGDGRMPEPARPTWNELINGSMDVQWIEFRGLVTEVQSNRLTLLLPEGHLKVQMEDYREEDLRGLEKAVVRIRGVMYAMWEKETRAVRVGSLLMRNASVGVDIAAPADPFDLPTKHPTDLFLFDPHATAFQRVKVRGQVVLTEPGRIFLMDGESGLRLLSSAASKVAVGSLIEAVGYPDISGTAPVLREAMVRKVGEAPLPGPRLLNENHLVDEGLDSVLVRLEGTLMGTHLEQGVGVLEMQANGHLFPARYRPKAYNDLAFRPGSVLVLTGIYVKQAGGIGLNRENGGFELLMQSSASVAVLSEPSWWTTQRLLTMVGVLVVGLTLAGAWITQLRRQVELRTQQLQREIREREIAERQRAVEAERSRIAQDLHDDLGASLTEIGVLASTGQRGRGDEEGGRLFRSIATKARDLISALDVIVWAIDPEENALQSVADYISGFVREYLEHSELTCRFKVPVVLPPARIDGHARHALLLTVKESLNNIVRHGAATEVEFQMAATDKMLRLTLTDNGKGFNPSSVRLGSGLKNLSTRLVRYGGGCRIESVVGKGTLVTIELPLGEMGVG
jgi:signal transduction histidine kinase